MLEYYCRQRKKQLACLTNWELGREGEREGERKEGERTFLSGLHAFIYLIRRPYFLFNGY